MFSTGNDVESRPASASIRSIVVRARLASGAAYYDALGHPLSTEQEVLAALERDHVVHYRPPPSGDAAEDHSARDGELEAPLSRVSYPPCIVRS